MTTAKTSSSMCAVCRPVAGLVFVLVLSFACRADIITSGYVNPADPSTWDGSTSANVGFAVEDGELIVNGGSDIYSSFLSLGVNSSTCTGTVTITGAGSSLTNTSQLSVGRHAKGEMNVLDGAEVSGAYCGVGLASLAEGKLKVDGEGALATVTILDLGSYSKGTMKIGNGGSFISSGRIVLGYQPGASGILTVDGVDSILSVESYMQVGLWGAGTLNITNGGLVKAINLDIDGNDDYDSRVNMATGGMLALEGEAGESIAEFLELLTGTDELYFRTDNTASWRYITSGTLGIDYFLSYIDNSTSDLYGYTVLTIAGEPATVPEPSTMLLLVSGLAVFVVSGFVGRRSIWR